MAQSFLADDAPMLGQYTKLLKVYDEALSPAFEALNK